MNVRSIKSSPRWRARPAQSARRRATTLVEVIAGLVVLGTVLTGVLVARGRFLRQRAAADRQLRAVEAVDRLVDGWTTGGTSFNAVPRFASGPLPGAEGFRWRTTERRNPDAAALTSHVICVEVWGPGEAEAQRRRPIVSFDLLVHDRTTSLTANAGGKGAP